MITKNFKMLLASMLTSVNTSTNARNLYPLRTTNGAYVYSSCRFASGAISQPAFPNNPKYEAAQLTYQNGIAVGSGSTPPTENDYNLEAPITSGITVSVANPKYNIDKYYNAYAEFDVTITNTGSNEISISEICYKQIVYAGTTSGGYGAVETVIMLDRTVLDTPITIQSGDAGIIHYKIQTNSPIGNRTMIGDIPVVSFRNGTDEEVAALIDAAQNGLCDLHNDCGWNIGDIRVIHIDAFTGNNNTSHAAQDVFIVISSFEDYNNCGCVMQFDFYNPISETQPMGSTTTYADSGIYKTTLPALVDALPEWLKTRLKTFNVMCAPNPTGAAVAVENNKLALRAASEITRTGSYTINTQEGDLVPVYITAVNNANSVAINRKNKLTYANQAALWYTRSWQTTSYYYNINAAGNLDRSTTGGYLNIAPFGCL